MHSRLFWINTATFPLSSRPSVPVAWVPTSLFLVNLTVADLVSCAVSVKYSGADTLDQMELAGGACDREGQSRSSGPRTSAGP